jgi:dynein heavy chain, axonemal
MYKFEASVARMGNQIVQATAEIYREARKTLLPTPAKSHYLFNLRDLARVVQGIIMVRPYEGFDEKSLVRLWMHESLRVFGDRLVNDEDNAWMTSQLMTTAKSTFKMEPKKILSHLRSEGENEKSDIEYKHLRGLFFGDYLTAQSATPRYEEITDTKKLQSVFVSFLEEYNQMSRKKMDLVIFMFAVEHVARIARVLKIDRGNLLLVGVGGSGRQSLTRLAASSCDYEVFQIAISKQYVVVFFCVS